MFWWVNSSNYHQLCLKRTLIGQSKRLNQISIFMHKIRPFNHTKLCTNPQSLSVWDELFRLNRRKKIWKQKLALWEVKLKTLKIKSINYKMLLTKWRKETNKNKSKANKLIKMMFKPKKEQTKFLKKNFKNFYKVLNSLKNDLPDFIFAICKLMNNFNKYDSIKYPEWISMNICW